RWSADPRASARWVTKRLAGEVRREPVTEVLNLDGRSRAREFDRQVAVGDRPADRIAVVRARDVAHDATVGPDRLLAHHDGAGIRERDAREALRRLAFGAERLATLEVLVHLDREAEARLERVVLGRDVLAPQPVALLQAQG